MTTKAEKETMTTTILTDERLIEMAANELQEHFDRLPNSIFLFAARAIEQAVLQSPEVQRLRNIEKAALGVLDWTESKHRPPAREAIPCGESAAVRVHALADLHDALHPDSPSKAAAMEKQP